MKPKRMRELLEFKKQVNEMSDEDLARALFEVRILPAIEPNSAEEIVLDQAIFRLRGKTP